MKMKKLIALFLTLVTIFSLTIAVNADSFKPSVESKGAPRLVIDVNNKIGYIVDEDGTVLAECDLDCVIVTPIRDVDSSTEIPEEARANLKKAYQGIKDEGSTVFTQSTFSNPVVRDLFDISVLCNDMMMLLPPDGNVISLTFHLGVDPDVVVEAMVWRNGEWELFPLKNNGDGTVTVEFEHFCPIAFLVEGAQLPVTQDSTNVILWASLMVASLALVPVLLVVYRKKNSKKAAA